MYFNNAEWILSLFYPSLVWKRATEEKVIYLTFDDGPIPGVTEYVLEELKRFEAKATFFCVGDNIRKYPDVYAKILAQGHRTGNHTFNHIKGWNTDNPVYIENVRLCDTQMQAVAPLPSHPPKLFRPPYGKIKKSQIKLLRADYEIIMWHVLTGDYNKDLSPERCLKKALKYSGKGSIIVFHDSLKAEKNLKYALPRFLEHFAAKGFRFEVL